MGIISRRSRIIVEGLWVIVAWLGEQILATRRIFITRFTKNKAQVVFKYYHIIKPPCEDKVDFVTYDKDRLDLFGLGPIKK